MAKIPGRIPGRERWEIEDKLILSNATDKTGELKIYGGTAGEKSLEIFSGSTSIFQILATTTTVRLLGGASTPVQIGDAGSTSRSLAANDDLFVSGKLEVDGVTFFDTYVVMTGNYLCLGPSPAGSGLREYHNDLVLFGYSTDNNFVITTNANKDKNHDHAASTNPTLFIQSATNPDTANDEWISFTHDVTDGVIDCGSGTLNLGGTNVNFVNSTRTASTVTHDAYVTLEIGGTEYKFMLGS